MKMPWRKGRHRADEKKGEMQWVPLSRADMEAITVPLIKASASSGSHHKDDKAFVDSFFERS